MPPEQQSEPIAATAAAPRWTRVLANASVIAIALVLLLGIGVFFARLPVPPHVVFGLFLLAFAGQKIAVACDAWLRLRAPRADGVDPRAMHGSGRQAFGWVVYKLIAAAIAIGAAVYLFTAGAASFDRMLG